MDQTDREEMRRLVEELEQPGFFDDLSTVLDWIKRVYAADRRELSSNAADAQQWLKETGASLRTVPGNFKVGTALHVFQTHGLYPDMRVGDDRPASRTARSVAERLISQFLADISRLPLGDGWLRGELITERIERWEEEFLST